MSPQLVLASQSPRRQEILSYFSIPFIQSSPPFDEESLPFTSSPEDYTQALAKGKALSLLEKHANLPILAADTIVFYAGKVFGKPKDHDHAHAMLSTLAGQWHTVVSGVAVAQGDAIYTAAATSRVLLHDASAEEIALYQKQLNCYDKAGGYMIQGAGGILVDTIEGCYYNVMGLPIRTTASLLEKVDINLWHHLG